VTTHESNLKARIAFSDAIIALLDQTRDLFPDVNASVCTGCGLRRYDNWDDRQDLQVLQGLHGRVNRLRVRWEKRLAEDVPDESPSGGAAP